MTTDPTDCTPPPTFDVMALSRELRQAIDDLGYTHPTPVQREVFEPAKQGRDVVVQARTGTGKTAAFGMPVVDGLVQRNLAAVQVLILCPTRELALQVHRELDTLGRYRGVKSVAVYGGAPMARQVDELAAGAQVLAGTPGRVLDHLRRGSLDPRNIRVFILDESDEMLSMGFLPQINEILGFLPSPRQTLLFSATLPPDIQRLAETKLKDPLFLTLSGDQIGALDIQHLVYFTCGDKLKDFIQVLEVENPESAIVFCNTRDETKRVASALDRMGFSADWLNADLAQNEREKVMAATRGGELRFLVCTDVAARGIDISHLTHVINFDLPESPESYVHRTGRTGRAGRTGTAISLIEPSDIGHLYMLRLTYKIFPIEKQLPTAGELRTRQELDVVEMFADAFANRQIHPDDLSLARRLVTHESAMSIVAGLLRDHLGARPEAVREATESRRARAPKAESAAESASVGSGEISGRKSNGAPHQRAQLSGAPSREPRPFAGAAAGEQRAPREQREQRSSAGAAAGAPREQREPRSSAGPAAGAQREQREQRSSAGAAAGAPREQREARPPRAVEPPPQLAADPSVTSQDPTNSRAASKPIGSPSRVGDFAGERERRPQRSNDVVDGSQVYRDEDFEFSYSVSEPHDVTAESKPKALPSTEMREDAPAGSGAAAGLAELFVNVGRGDGAEPGEFLQLLAQAGLGTIVTVANVSVRRNHSFIKIPAKDFSAVEAALNGARIAGKVVMAERSRSSRS